jgi:hypothetical protein
LASPPIVSRRRCIGFPRVMAASVFRYAKTRNDYLPNLTGRGFEFSIVRYTKRFSLCEIYGMTTQGGDQ